VRGGLRALLQRFHVLPALSEPLDDRVLDGARIRAGDKVADVGAGTGLLTRSAAERVGPDGEVLAIDISVDALEALRANTSAPNVSYLIGCADILPLMDESVDVVFTHRTGAASETFRVLRSGGRISVYGNSDDAIGDLEQVFTSAGFTDVRIDLAESVVYLTAVKR
jgi:ubiquinone/menaquinone biosynthesis C-methylase UbiE